MTYTIQNTSAIRGASIWQRLLDLNESLAQRRAQHRAYRSTVSELDAMSNRDLIDIGVHPADIHTIARQAAYGA